MTEPRAETATPAPATAAEAPIVRSGYLYWVFKVILTPIMTVAFRPTIEGTRR